MFNINKLYTGLTGLIGYDPQIDTTLELSIDDDLLQSDSGVTIGPQLHPLLTYENIKQAADQFSKVGVATWNNTTTYRKGAVVKTSLGIYQSLADGNTGLTTTDSWRKTSLFSIYLRSMYEGAILKLFTRVYAEKKLHEVGKSLLDNVRLYEGVGNISNRVTPSGRFVGFKLEVKNPDTVAILKYIGAQFSGPTPLDLYLFHSSQVDPVAVIEITTTKSGSNEWLQIAQQILEFGNTELIPGGGHYYLGYYESDLAPGVEAVKKDISFSGRLVNCSSCTEAQRNSQLYGKWSKFLGVQPFYVNGVNLTPGQLWDEENEFLVEDTTFGLNFQMSLQCDLTDNLLMGKNILVNALTQQVLVDFLNSFAYSMRANQNKERTAQLAAVALDNQENGQAGEARKLTAIVKALQFDFSNLSSPCAPCQKEATRFRMGSVYRNR